MPQLGGYKKLDLVLFCEMLYRFLIENFKMKYQISEEFCLVIDTFKVNKMSYLEIKNDIIESPIDKIIVELNNI